MARAGRADVIACIDGHYTEFELKADPKLDATVLQHERGRQTEHAGGHWHVAASIGHVQEIHAAGGYHVPACHWCVPGAHQAASKKVQE